MTATISGFRIRHSPLRYNAGMTTHDHLEAVVDRLSAEKDVAAVWLFGSEATGRSTSQSDVDLGILFRARVDVDALVEMRRSLEDELGRPVDLVDMRECSPILAMQIVRSGRLLSERDRVTSANFVASVPSRRYDVLRVRRAAEQRLLERMSSGRA